jgi:hypothetical protein
MYSLRNLECQNLSVLVWLLTCTTVHSFKSPAIAAAIVRYSLLRQGAAICVLVQFSRYIPL